MTVAVEEFLKRIPDFELAGSQMVGRRDFPRPAPAAGDLRLSTIPPLGVRLDGRRTSM